MNKRILIFGLGNIAMKYVAIIKRIAPCYKIVGVDPNITIEQAKEMGLYKLVDSTVSQKSSYALGLICTPADSHIEIATHMLNCCEKLLIEKPISVSYESAKRFCYLINSLERKNDVKVISNMRFYAPYIYIKSQLDKLGDIFLVEASYGSYLPLQRPSVDYRTIYVAKEKVGGVLLDAIHDVDALSWMLGNLVVDKAFLKRCSDLDIAEEDYAIAVMSNHKAKVVCLRLDYLSNPKERHLRVVGSNGWLNWKAVGKELSQTSLLENIGGTKRDVLFQENNPLEDQMVQAIEWASTGNYGNLMSAEEAINSIELIKSIRAASNEIF